MADAFRGQSSPATFARRGVAITPGASDFSDVAKSVVLLTSGDVTVVPVDNADEVTHAFVGLPAGYVIPFQVRRVTAATATVVALYD